MLEFIKRTLSGHGNAATPPPALKDQWIDRCAQQYLSKSRVSSEDARSFAAACWEQRFTDSDSPEAAADEDMSYWESGEGANHG